MRKREKKIFYLDSSALTKIYLREDGSDELQTIIGKRERGFARSVELCVSRLGFPETLSAIRKQENVGTISNAVAVRLWRQILEDFLFPPSPYTIYEPSEAVVGYAAMIVAQHGLRAYDAVQLATALRIRAGLPDGSELLFVSTDHRLNKVARKEQFTVIDPAAEAVPS